MDPYQNLANAIVLQAAEAQEESTEQGSQGRT